jgi:hypothetical protein
MIAAIYARKSTDQHGRSEVGHAADPSLSPITQLFFATRRGGV